MSYIPNPEIKLAEAVDSAIHIPVVSGQGLRFVVNDMIEDYQRKIKNCSEMQIQTGAGTIESFRLGAKRMCYQQIVKDLQDRLLNCDPAFEPTDEQIEQASKKYAEKVFEGCSEVFKGYRCNEAKFTFIEMQKIIKESV